MLIWYLILAILWVLCAAMAIYLTVRIHRFSLIRRLAENHKVLSWLLSFLPVAALGLFALINIFTMLVVMLHFFLGFVLCDAAAFLLRKASKKDFGRDPQILAAIGLTVLYLGAGWFFAHHVFFTEYTFSTEKDIGEDLRIVGISDAHLGITLDGEAFARQMERVQQAKPDLVVIVGDFVDDDTKRQDMLEACRALGKLETTYGVFFVFGNHDVGYFSGRSFSEVELRLALAENGVTVLEDERVLIDHRLYLVGRQDRSVPGRLEASALTEGLDRSKYILLLDHQPNDYVKEAESGADLVLSGHTHGGHILPAGLIGIVTGANDRTYGTETRKGTVFVVTSGISGWAIPFKTGAISEIVVIDITSNGIS